MTTPGLRRGRIAPAADRRARIVALTALAALGALAGFAARASAEPFDTAAARAHVRMLASTIGHRPIGTLANAEARAYLVAALQAAGFEVRLQMADARRPELGRTARVVNIIATRTGRRPGSIALVSHYDSVPNALGAADAALGVAVCLEAARALGKPPIEHGLTVVLTDGEEAGLMGAVAFLDDPAIDDVQTYLNFEAIGSRGPSLLFEAGPGNGWILDAWNRAPRPRGSSLAHDVYARLPNDTDFSILKRTGIPGLNFASIHDSDAYHSPLDTTERLADSTIEHTGRNAVSIVRSLDRMDLTIRTSIDSVYFDVLGLRGVSYAIATQRWITLAAIVLGLAAAGRSIVAACRAAGAARLLLTALWALVGTAAAVGGALAPTMWFRFASPWNHPWYAHPDRLFVLIGAASLTSIWLLVRIVGLLPQRARGSASPEAVWAITLPAWIAIAVLAQRAAPTAAYLIATPLLVAGLAMCVVPMRRRPIGRASLVVLAFVAGLWLSPMADLLGFVTPVLGRLPIVTPTFIHPALLLAGLAIAAPPTLAVVSDLVTTRVRVTDIAVAGLLGAACLWVVVAPAYSESRPQRRVARFVQEVGATAAFWEVAGIEPFTDLDRRAGGLDWRPVGDGGTSPRVPTLRFPYVLRASAPPLRGAPSGSVAVSIDRNADGLVLHVDVLPSRPGLALTLHVPVEATPVDATIPGVVRGLDEWVATFVAPPVEGVRISASFRSDQEEAMRRGMVSLRVPGLPDGLGWQRLPSWLPAASVSWDTHTLSTFPLASLLDSTQMRPKGGSPDVR